MPLCAAKSAPFLTEVLQASLDCVHLDIDYDSRSGLSRRRIYPYGLFAAQGFWYCACYDYKRGMSLSLRVDRFRSVERVADLKPPTDLSLREWLRTYQRDAGDTLHLRAVVRGQGTKSLELTNLFGEITADERGEAVLDTHIPAAEIDFYASRLLTLGMDLHVESPPQLIEALRQRAQAIADLYSRVGSHP